MAIEEQIHGEYQGWYYSYEKREASGLPKNIMVIPKIKKIIPKELCKYYPLTEYNVKSLRNNYFYGSHPAELNDPFDINYKMLKFETSCDKLKYNLLFSLFGILSLTEYDTDPLMWSHYCSHKGFVVKYSLDKIPDNFLGPLPINYIDDFKPINHEDLYLKLLIASNIKFKKFWESENEWRFLLFSPILMKLPKQYQSQLKPADRSRKSRYFGYSKYFSIKEIVLGYKIFLNKDVKLSNYKNTGFDIFVNEKKINALLNLIIEKKYKTSIIDINPGEYNEFIKNRVSIERYSLHKYQLTFLK